MRYLLPVFQRILNVMCEVHSAPEMFLTLLYTVWCYPDSIWLIWFDLILPYICCASCLESQRYVLFRWKRWRLVKKHVAAMFLALKKKCNFNSLHTYLKNESNIHCAMPIGFWVKLLWNRYYQECCSIVMNQSNYLELTFSLPYICCDFFKIITWRILIKKDKTCYDACRGRWVLLQLFVLKRKS